MGNSPASPSALVYQKLREFYYLLGTLPLLGKDGSEMIPEKWHDSPLRPIIEGLQKMRRVNAVTNDMLTLWQIFLEVELLLSPFLESNPNFDASLTQMRNAFIGPFDAMKIKDLLRKKIWSLV